MIACPGLNYSPTCLYCGYCDHEISKKKKKDNDICVPIKTNLHCLRADGYINT